MSEESDLRKSSGQSVRGVTRPMEEIVCWIGVCVIATSGEQEAGGRAPRDRGMILVSGVETELSSREVEEIESWKGSWYSIEEESSYHRGAFEGRLVMYSWSMSVVITDSEESEKTNGSQ